MQRVVTENKKRGSRQTSASKLDTLKESDDTLEEVSNEELQSSVEMKIAEGLDKMENDRMAEEYDFKKHCDEATELRSVIEGMSRPEEFLIDDFNLSHLKPDTKASETRCESSHGLSMAQMMRSEMR